MLRPLRQLFRSPVRHSVFTGRKTRRPRSPQAWPSGIERLEDRALLSVGFVAEFPLEANALPAPDIRTTAVDGTISGRVFNDLNANGQHDEGEPPFAGLDVYADYGPFTWLPGPATVITDEDGRYVIDGLEPYEHRVRTEIPFGWRRTAPFDSSIERYRLIPIEDRQDLIYDKHREVLYITTTGGTVERYDIRGQTLLAPILVGDTLHGADITPDGNFLYAAGGTSGAKEGLVYKIDLNDGAITSIRYELAAGETGAWDIATSADGRTFVTTKANNVGGVFFPTFETESLFPLRELDLSTDTFQLVSASPGSGGDGRVASATHIARSDDHSLLVFNEPGVDAGPIFGYGAATGEFLESVDLEHRLTSSTIAVNRDGTLIAVPDVDGVLKILDRDLNTVHSIEDSFDSAAFDPLRSILYAKRPQHSHSRIVAYDVDTWEVITEYDLGEGEDRLRLHPVGAPFPTDAMVVSRDGRFLFVETESGVRQIYLNSRLYQYDNPPTPGIIDFGLQSIPITGRTFHDANGNGLADLNEPGLAGRTVYVDVNDNGIQDAQEPVTTTDGNGYYAFHSLEDGRYTIRQAPVEGWSFSTPLNGARDVLRENLTTSSHQDFGSFPSNVVSGRNFHDLNENGAFDPGDPPLAGWTIYADLNDNGLFNDAEEPSAITDSEGRYEIIGVRPGRYSIRAVPVGGWQQTLPVHEQAHWLIPVENRRDLIYDDSRNILFITTGHGTVERFDVAENMLLSPFEIGGDLYGGDLTVDGRYLYVADAAVQDDQGIIRKIDLVDGTVTDLAFELQSGESGAWDVSIANSQTALITPRHESAGAAALRELALDSGTFTLRNEVLSTEGDSGSVGNTQIARSADRSILLSTEAHGAHGLVHVYEPGTDVFSSSVAMERNFIDAASAVSRDGTLIAVAAGEYGTAIMNRSFETVRLFGAYAGGVAFHPSRDILYLVDHDADQIVAYDTTTWMIVEQFAIGEDVPSSQAFDEGTITVSSDGVFLFLSTPSGVRRFQFTNSPYRGRIDAGEEVANIDFGHSYVPISGRVFHDLNGDGSQNESEPGIAGRTVYLDTNQNGALDSGEPTVITNDDGRYEFGILAPGTYTVREILPQFWEHTTPANNFGSGSFLLNLDELETLDGNDFGSWVVKRPQLVLPLRITMFDATPTFEWTAIPGAHHYELWVNNVTNGQSPVLRLTVGSDTKFKLPLPLADGNLYVWTVRAVYADGTADVWAHHRTFAVDSDLSPDMVSPWYRTFATRPTFRWSNVLGAERYDLWVNDLTTGEYGVVRDKNISGTSFIPDEPLPAGHRFIWTIRAISNDGTASPWESHQVFRIDTTGPARLNSPGEVTLATRPRFEWDGLPGADYYDLWINDLSTGQSGVIRERQVSGNLFVPDTPLVNGHRYVWTVRGMTADGQASQWAAHAWFRVDSSLVPQIAAPSPFTLDRTPTFVWGSVPGAEDYEIWVNDLTTGESAVIRRTTSSQTNLTPRSSDALTIGHDYIWTVRAIAENGGPGPWARHAIFRITDTVRPSLLHPGSITTDTTPTLAWTPVPGASRYDVWINDQTTGETAIVRNSQVEQTTFTIGTPLSVDHHYQWSVRAFNDQGDAGQWSVPRGFTIKPLPAPVPLTPNGSDVTTHVNFAWTEVPGAVRYDVWVNNLTTGQSQVPRFETTSTSALRSGFQIGHRYIWTVRAINADGFAGEWAPHQTFTVNSTYSSGSGSGSGGGGFGGGFGGSAGGVAAERTPLLPALPTSELNLLFEDRETVDELSLLQP